MKTSSPQFTYIAQDLKTYQCKIGRSQDPWERIHVLYGLNAGGLRLIAILALEWGERMTQIAFSQYKVHPELSRNEWYYPHPTLLRFAASQGTKQSIFTAAGYQNPYESIEQQKCLYCGKVLPFRQFPDNSMLCNNCHNSTLMS